MPSRALERTVHPTAVVLPGVELGTGVEVGPYAVLEPGVVVGDGCRIGPHVHLLGDTVLGPGCVVRSGTVLGGEPQDEKYAGERTRVRIGAHCQFHEHVTVHRGTGAGAGATVIGDGVRMMAGSHVAHDARVQDGAVLINGTCVGGHAEIGAGAILSSNVGVHQHGRVGRLALVTGSSAVQRDVPPFSIAGGGHPTRWRAPNTVGMRRAGFAAETRDAVRHALHALFREGRVPQHVARELTESPYPEVAELAAFVLAPGRALCRGPAD